MSTSDSSNQYYILASSVVFFYDFVLTIPQEIKYLWFSKKKLGSVLVIALRYITALGYIPVLLLTFTPNIFLGERVEFFRIISNCQRFAKIPGIVGIICQGITLVFLVIRLFAIYDKKLWVLCVTVPFGLVNVVLSSLVMASTFGLPAGFSIMAGGEIYVLSCFASPGTKNSAALFKSSYLAAILFDTLIFALAIFKTGRMYLAEQWHGRRPSIASILLRDGAVLYSVLVFSNISNFVLLMLSIGGTNSSLATFAVKFVVSSGTNSEMTHALSVILVSRMVFNLREAGTEVHEGTEEWRSRVERSSKHLPVVNGARGGQGTVEDDYGIDVVDTS